jgi:IclR family KDG regulon transcriptional repressor
LNSSNSLERALVLLKVIEQVPGGLQNAEISRKLKIPKSSCSYILRRLERAGYLIRDETTGRYRIGLVMVALAHGALREIGIRSVAETALYKLTSQTGLSAGIGVLERGRVLLIDRLEGPEFVSNVKPRKRDQRDIGRELPAHSTALGKALLAHLPTEQVLELIGERGLARSTPKTIVSKAKLLQELETVRRQGYAIADEEADRGLRALAAPIFDADGTARAAVSVNGSPSEAVWNELTELVRLVEVAARDISKRSISQRTISQPKPTDATPPAKTS